MNLLLFNLAMDRDDAGLGFTVEWVNALAERCEHVWVITMLAGAHDSAPNVRVLSVGRERGYSEFRRGLRFYWLLWRLLRRERIDVCFAHMMPLFAAMAWPLLAWRRIPIVLWYAHGHVSWLLSLTTRLVDRVVTSGTSGFRIRTSKLRILQQGIDTQRFAPSAALSQGYVPRPADPGAQRCILTIGRVSRVKGLEVVLRAFAALPAAQQASAYFKSVGDPLTADDQRYAHELRELALSLGISERVKFEKALPFRSIPEELSKAEIFVNASSTNSIDKAVLEAMSCGLPIVTTNPAFRPVLGEALAEAWLVTPGNIAAFKDRLQQLLELPQAARQQLGLTLRSIVTDGHSLSGLRDRIMAELEQCRGRARQQQPPPVARGSSTS